jgi:hypothetical protein
MGVRFLFHIEPKDGASKGEGEYSMKPMRGFRGSWQSNLRHDDVRNQVVPAYDDLAMGSASVRTPNPMKYCL